MEHQETRMRRPSWRSYKIGSPRAMGKFVPKGTTRYPTAMGACRTVDRNCRTEDSCLGLGGQWTLPGMYNPLMCGVIMMV